MYIQEKNVCLHAFNLPYVLKNILLVTYFCIKSNNKYRPEQLKMSRHQREPRFILLTPPVFDETKLYKCSILIFQRNVRLRLGAACC